MLIYIKKLIKNLYIIQFLRSKFQFYFFSNLKVPKYQILNFIKSIKPKAINYPLIRIGGESDGGYLIPDCIDDIDACFSPGVGVLGDFELTLTKLGKMCYLADYSVDIPPLINPLIDFEKKFIDVCDDAKYITLASWISSKYPNSESLLLQMDIEGSEYESILCTEESYLTKFKIMIIEFHNLHKLSDPLSFGIINATFQKILKHFYVVHIHPNNCFLPVKYKGLLIPPIMEFSFARKDNFGLSENKLKFPNDFDAPNIASKINYSLPDIWYEN